jgi:hypothetical protein
LIRLVRTPDGEIRLDLAGRVAGRGAYVHRAATCITDALKRRQLDRALKYPVPAELARTLAAIGEGLT